MKICMKTFTMLLLALHCGVIAAAEPFRIGLSLGLSGRFAEMSDQQQKGLRLWERDVNARGGLLGRPVQVMIQDDRSDPVVVRERYEQMINASEVDFLFAPYSSPLTGVAALVSEKHGWPMIVAGAGADSMWEKGYKGLIGVWSPSSLYMPGLFEVMVKTGLSRIAILHADGDNFALALADSAKVLAKRYGMTVVHAEPFPKAEKDLSGQAARSRAAEAEAVITCGHLEESVNMRLALKRIGWTPRLYFATVGPAVQAYGAYLKADAEFAFSSTLWEASANYPGARNFFDNFSRAWGKEPSYHAATAYAGGQVLEAAVVRAKSLDRASLATTLFQMDTMTILGRYGVGRTGKQLRQQSFIIQWQKGKREIVHPEELATAKPVIR